MKTDLHNSCRAVRCLSPAAHTTVAGRTGKPVDRKGFNGVELVVDYGSITATDATLTLVVFEGDATGSMTSVADADLLGTEALAGIAAGARTSGTGKNVSKRIGYKGNKRYVNAKITSTVTAGTITAVTALLHTPEIGATANP